MAFDIFDTDATANTGNVFTNGNLTVLGAAGYALTSSGTAQAREGKTSGKWYVEVTLVAASGNNDGIGIVAAAGVGSRFVGDTQGFILEQGWGYFNTNGLVVKANAGQTSVNNTTYVAGDVICMAIDLDNKKLWFRKNGGSWIGTSGTPDPVTNTAGFDITALMNYGRIYPAVNLSGATSKFTANFGTSAFARAVPSGFTAGWTYTAPAAAFGTFATTGRGSAGINCPVQNTKLVSPWTSTFTGTLNSMTLAGVKRWNHIKGLVYDGTGVGGLPGALLGVSGVYSPGGLGGELVVAFSGVNLVNGSKYWFGVISDVASGSATDNVISAPPGINMMAQLADSYAAPSNPFGASPTMINFRIPMVLTGTLAGITRRRQLAVVN